MGKVGVNAGKRNNKMNESCLSSTRVKNNLRDITDKLNRLHNRVSFLARKIKAIDPTLILTTEEHTENVSPKESPTYPCKHEWEFEELFAAGGYHYLYKCGSCGKYQSWKWECLTTADKEALKVLGKAPKGVE